MLPERETLWTALEDREPWDVVVIGGGITGAGVFREAVRQGWRTLLLEARDFAWGTSSRSSKLVHGGLRYLKSGHILLTRDSVRDRQKLLHEGQDLVTPLPFLVPAWRHQKPGRLTVGVGLALYDLLGGRWQHQRLSRDEMAGRIPGLAMDGLQGGWRYLDAQVDDARLVLRLVFEGIDHGGVALAYARVRETRRDGSQFRLTVQDTRHERAVELSARSVVHATGSWPSTLPDAGVRLRPLRGSHLMFSASRVPIDCAVTFPHSKDRRPMFLLPWEGAVVYGTTDLDHEASLNDEPRITVAEVDYLLEALADRLPGLALERRDIVSSWAGIRPIVDSGPGLAPSRASREHRIQNDRGLVTITGGKLTNFRRMALEAMLRLVPHLEPLARVQTQEPLFDPPAKMPSHLPQDVTVRLTSRYGVQAQHIASTVPPEDLRTIPGSRTLWAELRWAARAEAVQHLDDLLLRRTRIGLLLPEGGRDLLTEIRQRCQTELGWSDDLWQEQETRYLKLWQRAYGVP